MGRKLSPEERLNSWVLRFNKKPRLASLLLCELDADPKYKQQTKKSISENNSRLLCSNCNTPVYFAEIVKEDGVNTVYFKHRKAKDENDAKLHERCFFHTTEYDLNTSNFYKGEGSWHLETKLQLAKLLAHDPFCKADSIAIEKFIFSDVSKARRKPDIYFETTAGNKVVIELTNHWMDPRVAVEREAFFKEKGIAVIWLLSPKLDSNSVVQRYIIFGMAGAPSHREGSGVEALNFKRDDTELQGHLNGYVWTAEAEHRSIHENRVVLEGLYPDFKFSESEGLIKTSFNSEQLLLSELTYSPEYASPFFCHAGENYVEAKKAMQIYFERHDALLDQGERLIIDLDQFSISDFGKSIEKYQAVINSTIDELLIISKELRTLQALDSLGPIESAIERGRIKLEKVSVYQKEKTADSIVSSLVSLLESEQDQIGLHGKKHYVNELKSVIKQLKPLEDYISGHFSNVIDDAQKAIESLQSKPSIQATSNPEVKWTNISEINEQTIRQLNEAVEDNNTALLTEDFLVKCADVMTDLVLFGNSGERNSFKNQLAKARAIFVENETAAIEDYLTDEQFHYDVSYRPIIESALSCYQQKYIDIELQSLVKERLDECITHFDGVFRKEVKQVSKDSNNSSPDSLTLTKLVGVEKYLEKHFATIRHVKDEHSENMQILFFLYNQLPSQLRIS